MTLSGGAWAVFAVAAGVALLFAAAGLRMLTRPRPATESRRWATPMLRGRTLEERLREYVEHRNKVRDDFDDLEAAVALGASTREVADALQRLQRKGLVRAR